MFSLCISANMMLIEHDLKQIRDFLLLISKGKLTVGYAPADRYIKYSFKLKFKSICIIWPKGQVKFLLSLMFTLQNILFYFSKTLEF